MRILVVLRCCLMLVLVLNGLVAVHAGPRQPLPAEAAGHALPLGMGAMADAGCNDEPPPASLPEPPASDTPMSCCADLCLCACAAPVLSSAVSSLSSSPWAAVRGLAGVDHYPSRSPGVLLRPPIA